MKTTQAQLKQIQREFRTKLAAVRREELRIFSQFRAKIDSEQTKYIKQSFSIDS